MQMIMPLRRRRPVSVPSQLAPLFSTPFMGMQRPMPNMATDITTTDEAIELTMELPGFSKDDVTLELKDGYLVVNAELAQESEEGETPKAEASESEQPKAESSEQGTEDQKECGCGCGGSDQKGSWVRRERFFGSCTRSFYVGDEIEEDGITAKFENGLLKVNVPKKVEQPEPEQKKLIQIEG